MAAELPLIMKGSPITLKRMVSGTDFVALGVGGTGVDLSAGGGTGFVLKQAAGGVISSAALIAADIPNLAASIITSGTLAVARGGTGADLSATGGANQIVRQNSSGGAFTVSVLAAADIPSLDASKITTGSLAVARGGSGADLSATGGANQIVRQSSVGGAFTVSVLAAADIPNLDTSKLTTGQLGLARGGTGADLSATGGANQIVRQNSSGGAFTVSVLAAADIPNLDTSKITTGTFAVARLGSGSPVASSYVDGGTGAWTALPTPTQLSLTNGEASAFIVGNVVYSSAAGTVKKAQANALGTSYVVGLTLTATAAAGSATIQSDGVVTLSTGQWDAVAGTTGGLAFGTVYYLSAATAGLLTATAPSTTGQQWVQVGIGLSTTQMKIEINGPIGV